MNPETTPLLWIVDDEQAICWALRKAFVKEGYKVEVFSNASDALANLENSPTLQVVLVDMRMPGMDGVQATEKIKHIRPDVPVILMTAFGDLSTAVQAIDADVFEYLNKPFDLQDALKVVSKAITSRQKQREILQENPSQIELIGHSPAIQSVYKQIAVAARCDAPVLIRGPVGSGKEMIAAAIHQYSKRKDAPFLVITPSAIAPIALSLEILGGSLGGKYRSGALELATSGHLFFDEIADLTMPVQKQLLRFLETNRFTPFSGTSKDCNTRIIASTSRDLDSLIRDGEFMDALAQRMSVLIIDVAPLANRKQDIVPIARTLLNSAGTTKTASLSHGAEKWLTEQAWPGDLRQLESVVQRARLSCRGDQILVDELIASYEKSLSPIALVKDDTLAKSIRDWTRNHLTKLEREGSRIQTSNDELFGTMHEDFMAVVETPFLQAMMEAFGNNRANVAAQLGLHRSTLRQKMRKYDLDS